MERRRSLASESREVRNVASFSEAAPKRTGLVRRATSLTFFSGGTSSADEIAAAEPSMFAAKTNAALLRRQSFQEVLEHDPATQGPSSTTPLVVIIDGMDESDGLGEALEIDACCR